MSPALLIQLAEAISRFLGWSYTLAWSLSFYPQPVLNYQRRSTIGTTPSFPTINVLGFTAYLVSNCALYASPVVRAQYAARNPVSPEPTVRLNDIAFGVHAVLLSAITWSMFSKRIWGFQQGRVKLGKGTMGIALGCLTGVLWMVGVVLVRGRDGGNDPSTWAWIDVIYAVGFCKLLISISKCIPQIWVNYKSKSTEGWSIDQVLLDLIGGVLSILQLVIDSSMQEDWSGLTGNPIKLGLGNISILVDVVFMVQHYILYRGKSKYEDIIEDERRRLLASDDDEESATGRYRFVSQRDNPG